MRPEQYTEYLANVDHDGEVYDEMGNVLRQEMYHLLYKVVVVFKLSHYKLDSFQDKNIPLHF